MDINWADCVLDPSSSIRDAIENLVSTSRRIVLVCEKNFKLLGTVSDGDIRRGILKGISLEDSIMGILQVNPIVVSGEASKNYVRELMLNNKVHQIPILSDNRTVVGLHEWDNFHADEVKLNRFVIMAGGLGKRLLPHTENTPKAMVLIHGRPMLEHIILRAKTNGFRNFTLVVHHLAQQIEEYFQDGSNFGVTIDYVKEVIPLGTAGGLSQLKVKPKESILVTNSDVISKINYANFLDFHEQSSSSATMAIRDYSIDHPFGVIELNGTKIVGIKEKPKFTSKINAGVYAVTGESLDVLMPNTSTNMTDFFSSLITLGYTTTAYPIHETWADIGRPEDLQQVSTSESI
jgi:dTDP-glucose pyrophosphorylase